MQQATAQRKMRGPAAVAAGLAAAFALSACGSPQGGEKAEPLTLWQYYGDRSSPTGGPLYDFVERYEKQEGVEVDVRFIPYDDFNRTLLQSAAGGDLPDIALINAFDTPAMAEAGVIQDISDRVKQWGQSEAYYDTGWRTTQVDGKTYGVPHVADAYAVYYNTEMLESAGVRPPRTWDEMAEVAAELAEAGRSGLAVSGIEGAEGATGVAMRMLAAGGELDRPAGPAGRESLEQFKEMTASGALSKGFLTWNEEDVKNQFAQERAAMMINSATYVSILREENPELKWDVALLPKDEKRVTYLGAENLTIGATSDDVEQAWDLIAFMQQPQELSVYLPERNKLPARDDVPRATEDPARKMFATQLKQAWAPEGRLAAKSNEVFTYLQESLQSAVSGGASPREAADQAQRNIDEALGR